MAQPLGTLSTSEDPSWHITSSPSDIKYYLSLDWASQNLPAKAGDIRDSGLIPGLGRSPGGGHGNPLQCSCPENPMDRGAWKAAVHGVAKSPTWLKWLSMYVSLDSVVDSCFYTYCLNFLVKIAVYVLIKLYFPQVNSWSFSWVSPFECTKGLWESTWLSRHPCPHPHVWSCAPCLVHGSALHPVSWPALGLPLSLLLPPQLLKLLFFLFIF